MVRALGLCFYFIWFLACRIHGSSSSRLHLPILGMAFLNFSSTHNIDLLTALPLASRRLASTYPDPAFYI